jgi:hypothetical protein
MITLRCELEGEQAVLAALHQTVSGLGDLKQANQGASQIVVAAARGRAPRRTGRLAASGQGVPKDKQASITFSVPYANPIHWGWRARNIRAQPFAITAAEATQPQWLRRYEDNIQQVIKGAGLNG